MADGTRGYPHDLGDLDLRRDHRRRLKTRFDARHRPAWHGVKGWLSALPWVMTGGAVGTLVAMRSSRLKRVGLFERLFYVASIAWFFIVAIELARIY